ncbi:MAG: hypothetical protein OEY64_02945 [Nitrospinota bacterium]|nr:hypothetical protein [Nitrospinota bacterium]
MKCPKCRYVTFEHLTRCGKCGEDLSAHKSEHGIDFPSYRTYSVVSSANRSRHPIKAGIAAMNNLSGISMPGAEKGEGEISTLGGAGFEEVSASGLETTSEEPFLGLESETPAIGEELGLDNVEIDNTLSGDSLETDMELDASDGDSIDLGQYDEVSEEEQGRESEVAQGETIHDGGIDFSLDSVDEISEEEQGRESEMAHDETIHDGGIDFSLDSVDEISEEEQGRESEMAHDETIHDGGIDFTLDLAGEEGEPTGTEAVPSEEVHSKDDTEDDIETQIDKSGEAPGFNKGEPEVLQEMDDEEGEAARERVAEAEPILAAAEAGATVDDLLETDGFILSDSAILPVTNSGDYAGQVIELEFDAGELEIISSGGAPAKASKANAGNKKDARVSERTDTLDIDSIDIAGIEDGDEDTTEILDNLNIDIEDED